MHALCVKRVSCIFKKLAADEDRAEEKRTRQKYVNADAALEIYRPIPLPLVEWKSIPDTSTINGRENNKLGSRSPRMFMRYGPPPNRSAGNVTIAATTTFETRILFFKENPFDFWCVLDDGRLYLSIVSNVCPERCVLVEYSMQCAQDVPFTFLYISRIFYEHELWFFM